MATSFLVVGMFCALLWWIIERRWRRRWQGWVLLAALALGASITWLWFQQVDSLGKDTWYETSPWRELILFAMTVIGMTFQTVASSVHERKVRLEELRKLNPDAPPPSIALDRWDFALPLLMAVPVFFILLSQLEGQMLTPLTFSMAFQNGFMWKAIIKELA